MANNFSFFIYDYESFGTNPASDRPAQFAGIRTDADFNIIGEPVMLYCKQTNDYLPAPEAVMVTGITPQECNEKGIPEPEFAAKILAEFSQPNTCVMGYNNIRYDDEMTRYTFYRNFIDPYEYSWKNGNSRWDLLDLVRACYALRPEGINWAYDDDGMPSFRLEKLTKANLRFVVSVAKQYQNQGLTLPDLINEGNLGLIKAAQRFDETRGFKFISYAVWWIRQSILQALAEQSRIVRLPLNKIGSINKINKMYAYLEQANERVPSAEEIARELDMSVNDVKESMKNAGRHISMDAPLVEGEDSNLYDVIRSNESPNPDKSLILDSLRTEIERALETLTPREADVIRLYFGLGDQHAMTLEEIGETFDLTRERVRQIKEKAIRRLKHTSRSKILKTYLG